MPPWPRTGSGAEPCGPHPVGPLLGQAAAGGVRNWAVASAGQYTVRDLRVRLFDRLLTLPVSFFDRTTTGSLLARLQTDAGAVYSSGAGAGPQSAYAALSVLGGSVLPVLDQPPAWTSPPGCTPRGRRDRGVRAPDPRPVAGLHRSVGGHLDAGGGCPVRGAGDQDLPRRDRRESALRGTVRAAVELGLRRARIGAWWNSVIVLLASLGSRGVGVVGRPDDPVGGAERRQLLAVVWYGLIVTRGIADLAGQYSRLQQVVGSADRVVDLLTEPQESDHVGPDLRDPLPGSPAVQLHGVTFTYPPERPAPALRGLDLTIEAGTTVALVGESGAGKSTVARLLQRHYRPDVGRILLRGRDLTELPLRRARSRSRSCRQDIHLLQRHGRRQPASGTSGCHRRTTGRRCDDRVCPFLHPETAAGVLTPSSGTWGAVVRRPAATAGNRPGTAGGRTSPDPRRSDVSARSAQQVVSARRSRRS